jgi:quinol monooxygenase YgiN
LGDTHRPIETVASNWRFVANNSARHALKNFSANKKDKQEHQPRTIMNKNVKLGILATLKAKPGKEDEVEQFLKSALPLANQEMGTIVWFALRIDHNTFAIFDAFEDESGRDAHLSGPIAAALMAKWKDLLAEPPDIKKIDVMAAKLVQ